MHAYLNDFENNFFFLPFCRVLSEYLLLANMLINWLSLLVRVFTENQTCCFQTDFTIFEVELSAKKSSIVPGNVELSGVLCGFLVVFFVVVWFCFDVVCLGFFS